MKQLVEREALLDAIFGAAGEQDHQPRRQPRGRESLSAKARLCGFVDWIMLNAPSRIHQPWIHSA